MTAKETIMNFEKSIRTNSFINIVKRKQKDGENWKLVYNIEGITNLNYYIPFVQFVFFMNSDITEFSENIVIVNLGIDKFTENISNIDNVFDKIKENSKIKIFGNFIFDALFKFNKLVDDPFNAFYQIRGNDIVDIDEKLLRFKLERIAEEYTFDLNITWDKIIMNNVILTITQLNDIYNIVIKEINKNI